MRKKSGILMTSKVAEAGIGTLVLFIAFILVASIAASVLISTGSSLQSKALNTGSRTEKSIASGIAVLSIYGENASITPEIGYLYSTIRLSPGSDSVILNFTSVDVFTGEVSQSYQFNQSGNCSQEWLSNVSVSAEYFAVEGKEGYTLTGIMQFGDVVLVCTRLPALVSESTKITWQFTPKIGTFTKVKTETPAVMASTKTFLYP